MTAPARARSTGVIIPCCTLFSAIPASCPKLKKEVHMNERRIHMPCTLPSFYTTGNLSDCRHGHHQTFHSKQASRMGPVPFQRSTYHKQVAFLDADTALRWASCMFDFSFVVRSTMQASCHTMKLLRYTCLSIPPLLSVSCRSSPSALNDLLEQLVCPCQAWRHCTYILWFGILAVRICTK